MKTLGLAGLLIGACILLSGCPGASFFDHDNIPYVNLYMNFQDASGKDLTEGIEYVADSIPPLGGKGGAVKPELYTLRLFEDGKKHYPGGVHGDDFSAIMYLQYFKLSEDTSGGLFFNLYGTRESRKEFSFLFTCPYIFGDDAEHEITAYLKKKVGAYAYTRLTFDGKDIDLTKHEYGNAYATIVLD